MIGKTRHIAITLLLLFSVYYALITLFPHVHTERGQTIVHSHPYLADDASTAEHPHTPEEFQSISQLSFLLSLAAVNLVFFFSGPTLFPQTVFTRPVSSYRRTAHTTHRHRGPPATVSDFCRDTFSFIF